jgi:hypothetical protein
MPEEAGTGDEDGHEDCHRQWRHPGGNLVCRNTVVSSELSDQHIRANESVDLLKIWIHSERFDGFNSKQ